MNEIKANFEKLLTQYPSGMRVNSLLAAKNFGLHQENILVGNGAAELIKSFMGFLEGTIGVVRPTFEEYPNRYDKERLVVFTPENEDFQYDADDLMTYFADKKVDTLLIINPDNPTGNYIAKQDVLRMAQWTKEQGMNLVIDESFVDFAEEEDSTLLVQDILNQYPHLFVMKSISKSYGVPGLRLGVFASGNIEMIAKMKKDVAIWNINSFAEFYMQIEEKYKKDYAAALVKIRAERARFVSELKQIAGIRVIPSQANYIMLEITNGMSSKELTKKMLIHHNLFIKDLSGKINRNGKQFVRIAVRDTEDNDQLVEALKMECQ